MISNIEVTKRAHISRRKYVKIYKCFVGDILANKAYKILNINRIGIKSFLKQLSSLIE